MKTQIVFLFSFLLIPCLYGQSSDFEKVLALDKVGKFKKALTLLDQIIESSPPQAYLISSKAVLLSNDGRFQEGVQLLHDAETFMPDSFRIYNKLAELYISFKQYDQGKETFQRAYIRCRDNACRSLYQGFIGGLLYSTQDFRAAKTATERSILLDSTNLDPYNTLALIYRKEGKVNEALKALNKIIEIDTSYVGGYINIGFVLQKERKYEESLPYFDKAIQIDSLEPLAYSNRSFSKLHLNDLEGAMKDINRSLELDGSNSYAYKIRALIYIEKGETKAACKDLETAIGWRYTAQYGPEVEILQSIHCK